MSIAVLPGVEAAAASPAPRGGHLRGAFFRADVEGLRGVAIAAVVAFHCGVPGIGGGFVGVDIFFVLSGYLITSLLLRELDQTRRLDFRRFYGRRVRRLLPASALMLLVTMTTAMVVFAPSELMPTARAARAAGAYLSNVFFAVNAADYFAPRVELNPILHTWSLAVEEQFYLVWPLLIAVAARSRSRSVLVSALAAVTIVSLAMSVWFSVHQPTFAFYQLPTRAWEFGAGGLASLLSLATAKRAVAASLSAGTIGAAMVAASIVLMPNGEGFPGWIAIVPVVGTCLLLVAGTAGTGRGFVRVLEHFVLQRLGTWSYSWYLWHWPAIVFAGVLVPSLALPGKVVASLVALGMAGITHRLIENPIRFHPALVKRDNLCLALGAVLTLATIATATYAMNFSVSLAQSPSMKVLSDAAADIARMPRAECVSLGLDVDVKTCHFGTAASATGVVLFGDSHAIHWFNPVVDIAERRGWSLTTVLKSGCLAVDVAPEDVGAESQQACAEWRRRAMQTVLALRPSIVIIAGATNRQGDVTREYLAELADGTLRTVQALAAGGSRVVVIRDVPRFRFDVPTCLGRALRHAWYSQTACELPLAEASHPAVFVAEQRAVRAVPRGKLIDMTDVLCPNGTCRTESDGRPMYRDDNHLTGAFAESLRSVLDQRLQAAVM